MRPRVWSLCISSQLKKLNTDVKHRYAILCYIGMNAKLRSKGDRFYVGSRSSRCFGHTRYRYSAPFSVRWLGSRTYPTKQRAFQRVVGASWWSFTNGVYTG